jgi:hypothetical protein
VVGYLFLTAVKDVIFSIIIKTFTVIEELTPTNGEDAGIVAVITMALLTVVPYTVRVTDPETVFP